MLSFRTISGTSTSWEIKVGRGAKILHACVVPASPSLFLTLPWLFLLQTLSLPSFMAISLWAGVSSSFLHTPVGLYKGRAGGLSSHTHSLPFGLVAFLKACCVILSSFQVVWIRDADGTFLGSQSSGFPSGLHLDGWRPGHYGQPRWELLFLA